MICGYLQDGKLIARDEDASLSSRKSLLESSASHYCVNVFLGFEDGKLESIVGRVTGSKGY